MTRSKVMVGRPRPTPVVGLGRPLLSHKRGDSTQPAESTTTLAVSVVSSPVKSRPVTPLARPASSV